MNVTFSSETLLPKISEDRLLDMKTMFTLMYEEFQRYILSLTVQIINTQAVMSEDF